MGSRSGASDESPEHVVRLGGFLIAKHEVTFDEFDRFCEETGRAKPSAGGLIRGNWEKMGGRASDGEFGWPRGDRPVINVSWRDAAAFCDWLSGKTGRQVRLPTEAEWEYACCGGDSSPGMHADDAQAWHSGNADYQTHAVMKKVPNALGLYDMLGNVWEWCGDWYDPAYYSRSDGQDPKGPAEGRFRVVRGGSWVNEPGFCTASNRRGCDPDYTGGGLGFRVVASLVSGSSASGGRRRLLDSIPGRGISSCCDEPARF
ncbi:MAG: formylglycine-generating enzyme family protein [Acidobacteria bacterium]|jgi:formylglycine-generating enzyme required for sulfatase activity|nr:formylglycine-generating enzyme family protein [Acidobacteriota bacterium]